MKLNVAMFWHLKQAGAFAAYGKVELLDGEMSGVPLPADDEPKSAASIPIKLRAQDYLLLDQEGLLDDFGQTELIDGTVYGISPQHRPHWFVKNELGYRLRRALETIDSNLYAGIEGSVLLSDVDIPEPDIVLTTEPVGTGLIPLASVRLLIEIADTSRNTDIGTKAKRYAAAAISEYWLADVNARIIQQMWAPIGESFTQRHEISFGDPIAAATIPGLAIATTGL